jgi:spermidine dehydrogenase
VVFSEKNAKNCSVTERHSDHCFYVILSNRWPHGYGYEYNRLFDPDWPEAERPNVIGRKPFGRSTIANTDSGATAYRDVAIEQAYRAVQELMTE